MGRTRRRLRAAFAFAGMCFLWLSPEPALAAAPPRYELTVTVQAAERRLEVCGTVAIEGLARGADEVRLSLFNNATDLRVRQSEDGGEAAPLVLTREQASGRSTIWTAHLAHPVSSSPLTLEFEYSASGDTGIMFHVDTDVVFASAWGTDWYPLVVGHPDKAVGVINIVMPVGQIAIAGDAGAANAPGRQRFRIDHPTYFSFAAGAFTAVHGTDQKSVTAYVLHPHATVPALLAGMNRVVAVLEDEFGPRPFRSLALVEVPRAVAQMAGFNAASVPGFVLVNSNAFEAPKIDYLAEWLGHETAHQWFPHSVALETPPGLYLEEALAEYGGLRVVEALLGDAAAERFRRSGFEYDPMFSAAAYFQMVRSGQDHALRNLDASRTSRTLAYNKSFFVFSMLADEVGEAVFRAALHKITKRHAFGSLSLDAFERAVEETAGRDLEWFFLQWLDRTGAPTFQLAWRADGGTLRGTITQPAPYYRATLDLELAGRAGQRKTIRISADGARSEFALRVDFPIGTATLDPHYRILRWPAPGAPSP